MPFPTFWDFVRRSSLNILTELWLFQNSTYFLILWPSYGTFVLQKLYGFVLWQTTYVDQVCWWLVKNCDLYRRKCDNFI